MGALGSFFGLFSRRRNDEAPLESRLVSLLLLAGFIGLLWRVPAMIALFIIGLTLLALARASRTLLLRGVGYERRFSADHVFEGEQFTMWRMTSNRSRLPAASIRIDDMAPKEFTLVAQAQSEGVLPVMEWLHEKGKLGPDLTQLVALLPKERISRAALLRANKRGYYRFPDARVRVTDALGLADEDKPAGLTDDVVVYPRTYPRRGLPVENREPFGALSALRTLVEDNLRIVGARDYASGDEFRRIDWKASARRGKLQTRIHERASEPAVAVLLNVTTYEREWQGIAVESFERAVSVAASLASWADDQDWAVGLSSNGNAPNLPQSLRVRPRRAPRQLLHVMESLAAITAYPIFTFGLFLFNEQRYLPTTSAQIVVTPLVNPELIDAVRRLRAAGKRIAVITVDCPPPDIEGVLSVRAEDVCEMGIDNVGKVGNVGKV